MLLLSFSVMSETPYWFAECTDISFKKQHSDVSRGVAGADLSSMAQSISPPGDGPFYKMTTHLLHHLSTLLHSMRPEVLQLKFT